MIETPGGKRKSTAVGTAATTDTLATAETPEMSIDIRTRSSEWPSTKRRENWNVVGHQQRQGRQRRH